MSVNCIWTSVCGLNLQSQYNPQFFAANLTMHVHPLFIYSLYFHYSRRMACAVGVGYVWGLGWEIATISYKRPWSLVVLQQRG